MWYCADSINWCFCSSVIYCFLAFIRISQKLQAFKTKHQYLCSKRNVSCLELHVFCVGLGCDLIMCLLSLHWKYLFGDLQAFSWSCYVIGKWLFCHSFTHNKSYFMHAKCELDRNRQTIISTTMHNGWFNSMIHQLASKFPTRL